MRRPIQFILCLCSLWLAPFALMFLASPFMPSFWRGLTSAKPKELLLVLIFQLGGYGILALWASIIASPAFLQRHPRLRSTIIMGLIGGTITAMAFLTDTISHRLTDQTYDRLPFDIWTYGGPIIVAIWNTLLFLRKAGPENRPISGNSTPFDNPTSA